MSERILDHEQFPFTRAELRLALGLVLPPAEAEARTDMLARIADAQTDADVSLLGGNVVSSSWELVLPLEVFVLLAEVSPQLQARVGQHLEQLRIRSRMARRMSAADGPAAALDLRLSEARVGDPNRDEFDTEWERLRAEARRRIRRDAHPR